MAAFGLAAPRQVFGIRYKLVEVKREAQYLLTQVEIEAVHSSAHPLFWARARDEALRGVLKVE